MNKLQGIELFAGIGGFSLGLERTEGFHTKLFSEVDKGCIDVLNKNYPNIPVLGDIRNITKECVGELDYVTASWPCQGHSTAGKKRGLNDERSGLWKEVKRLLQETQPKWFIGENSANLRSNGLTEVLQDLWEIGFRDIRWDVLPAEAYGALHKRERIYIVANSHGIRLSEAPFTPSEKEQERGAKARASFDNRSCPEPAICGVDDALPKELERIRKQQVKQYGNSLLPDIPESIGRYILELERLSE